MTPPRLYAPLVLFLSLAAGAVARLYFAVHDDGIYWPDEVYQSLEPAHRAVFGYGMVAWEFIDGARHWALPGLVAGLLWVAKALGLDGPSQYVTLVKMAFALFGVGSCVGAYALGKAAGATRLAAATGAAALALAAPAIYFSPRAMAENASGLVAAFGLAALLPKDSTRRARLLGASLLGLAVMFRLQCGLFAAGAVVVLLAQKRGREAREVFGVLCLWAVLFGFVDHLAWAQVPDALWGGWFHSAVKYVRFNLIEGKGSAWGVAPGQYYAINLYRSMPLLMVLVAPLLVASARKATGLFCLALAFFVLHMCVPHKELRFLVPLFPLVFALAAVGLSSVEEGLSTWLLTPLVLFAALVSFIHTPHLSFGELGAYPERPGSSAWDDSGPVNRLMLAASKAPSLCGLRIDAVHLAWAGGITYLHRDAPLYHLGSPAPQTHFFNYVITGPGSGAEVVAREGGLELVKLPWDSCAKDPGYTWRLP